jgi:hypothetical protein
VTPAKGARYARRDPIRPRSSGPTPTLASLARVADYANHAVPNLDEVQAAFDKLAAAKLVRTRKAEIALLPKALELEAKMRAAAGRSVRTQIDALLALLRCPCCGAAPGRVRERGFPDAQAWRRAVGER